LLFCKNIKIIRASAQIKKKTKYAASLQILPPRRRFLSLSLSFSIALDTHTTGLTALADTVAIVVVVVMIVVAVAVPIGNWEAHS